MQTGSQILVGNLPQALVTDATGQDAYVVLATADIDRSSIYFVNDGANGAILSCNGGTTDHFRIPGQSAGEFDGLLLLKGTQIAVKNAVAGSNYSGLTLTLK